MNSTASLGGVVNKIKKAFEAQSYKTYIKHIRFPSFKNLSPDSQIDFSFPVTALVGGNGCGKSSVLQALYGCPNGCSPGNYWFSTDLDPIDEKNGERPSIIYGYSAHKSDLLMEVLKTRINYSKQGGKIVNPDYWETSRPLKKFRMEILADGKRHPAIAMDVMAVDFRYQISAFDRYFYLEDIETVHVNKSRTKQDVIRLRSSKILKALQSDSASRDNKAEKVQTFSVEELSVISKILGKKYKSGRILKHRYHGFWAYTVVFELDTFKYTEANAGSGEIAVALLVHKMMRVLKNSLVLLDEPEYSLHPGAQRNLLEFLLKQSVEKKIQIVYTTHAPTMIDGLPRAAIKVFEQDAITGFFEIHQDRIAEEAFISIGHTVTTKTTIIVEDILAKLMLETLMEDIFPPDYRQLIQILYYPGGASRIKRDIVLYSQNDHMSPVVLFDGDQYKKEAVNPENLPTNEKTADKYKAYIKDITSEDIDFPCDGGANGGRIDQVVSAIERYLIFWKNRVFFLPFNIPEEEIWNPELAKDEISAVLSDEVEIQAKLSELDQLDSKRRFAVLAKTVYGLSGSEHILMVQSKFLRNWIKRGSVNVGATKRILSEIRQTIVTVP